MHLIFNFISWQLKDPLKIFSIIGNKIVDINVQDFSKLVIPIWFGTVLAIVLSNCCAVQPPGWQKKLTKLRALTWSAHNFILLCYNSDFRKPFPSGPPLEKQHQNNFFLEEKLWIICCLIPVEQIENQHYFWDFFLLSLSKILVKNSGKSAQC